MEDTTGTHSSTTITPVNNKEKTKSPISKVTSVIIGKLKKEIQDDDTTTQELESIEESDEERESIESGSLTGSQEARDKKMEELLASEDEATQLEAPRKRPLSQIVTNGKFPAPRVKQQKFDPTKKTLSFTKDD